MPIKIDNHDLDSVYFVDGNRQLREVEQIYVGVQSGNNVYAKPVIFENLPKQTFTVTISTQFPSIGNPNGVSVPQSFIVTSPGYDNDTGEVLPASCVIPSSLGAIYTTSSYSSNNLGSYYRFSGWYLNGSPVSGTIQITSDITLQAQWEYVGTRYYWSTLLSNGSYSIAGKAWDSSNWGRPGANSTFSKSVAFTPKSGGTSNYRCSYSGTIYGLIATEDSGQGLSSFTKPIYARTNATLPYSASNVDANYNWPFGHSVRVSGNSLVLSVYASNGDVLPGGWYMTLGSESGTAGTYKGVTLQQLVDRVG